MCTSFILIIRIICRCRIWVQNCGNPDLLLLPRDKLSRLRFLCLAHFEPQHFWDKYHRKLRRNAVPTIFSGNALTEEEMVRFDGVTPVATDTAGQEPPISIGKCSFLLGYGNL